MRHVLLIPLLAAALSPASALEGVDGVDGLAVTFDVLSYADQQFDMGLVEAQWSEGQRYELNFMATVGDREPVQPCGGVYVFYEQRGYEGTNDESADYDCWGVGLQGGATINLLPAGRKLGLGLVPYARGGLGYQDLTANNVPVDDDGLSVTPDKLYSLSADSGRVEVAAGVDLRLTIARRVTVVFGGGVAYWAAANVYISGGSNGGSVGVVGNSYAFSGTDAFVRMGAGISF